MLYPQHQQLEIDLILKLHKSCYFYIFNSFLLIIAFAANLSITLRWLMRKENRYKALPSFFVTLWPIYIYICMKTYSEMYSSHIWGFYTMCTNTSYIYIEVAIYTLILYKLVKTKSYGYHTYSKYASFTCNKTVWKNLMITYRSMRGIRIRYL